MHVQDDLNLCILCMFKGIFSLVVAHIMMKGRILHVGVLFAGYGSIINCVKNKIIKS